MELNGWRLNSIFLDPPTLGIWAQTSEETRCSGQDLSIVAITACP